MMNIRQMATIFQSGCQIISKYIEQSFSYHGMKFCYYEMSFSAFRDKEQFLLALLT